MASLVSLEESAREIELDSFFPRPHEFLRLDDDGDEAPTVEALGESAFDRIEAYIARRFIRRSIVAIVRTDYASEQIVLPIEPIAIATAEIFDADNGTYTADSFVNGPTTSSLILPRSGVWRLSGTAGPDPAEQPPEAVLHAWKLLVAWAYECRGDVRDDYLRMGFFRGTGAADLLKSWRRVA